LSGYLEPPTSFDRHVGRCLRASRMALGLSLAEAGTLAGVHTMSLQSWETGRRTCPLETLIALAAFYRARVTDFLP